MQISRSLIYRIPTKAVEGLWATWEGPFMALHRLDFNTDQWQKIGFARQFVMSVSIVEFEKNYFPCWGADARSVKDGQT
jgi:hypothetical protein